MIYAMQIRSDASVKIGYASNVGRREAELRSQFGELELLMVRPGAMEDEKRVHRQFSALRIYANLELFAPGEPLMDFLGHPLRCIPDVEAYLANHRENLRPSGAVPANEPRNDRRTTLSLTPAMWDDLKAIEDETGARPSVIVRRMLEKAIGEYRRATTST